MAYSNDRDSDRGRNERWRSHDRERDWENQYTQRDDDDSRLARESMERDHYGRSGGRGGYGGRGQEDQGPRYNRGSGQGDYDRNPGERDHGRAREYPSRYGGSEGQRHHGNDLGGWEGREDEQWRNRDVHGQYDRDANYGGFSSSGTGNYAGYGGSGGSQQGGRGRWGQAGTQSGGSQGDYNYPGYERSRYRQGQYGQDYGRSLGEGYGQERSQGQGGYGRDSYRQRGSQQGGHGASFNSGRPSGGRAYGNYSGSPSGYFGEDYARPGDERWGSQEQDYGQHRGRGPRGYKRSDDRIREEVCDCLTDDDELDASSIEVSVKDGEVTLSGSVASRDDKRWAESLAERISGVKEVQNSLRVQDQQRSQTGAQGSSTTSATSGTTGAGGRDKGKESNIQH